jgi:hypothetical protein
VAQVVESLYSKFRTLSSNPTTVKKKKIDKGQGKIESNFHERAVLTIKGFSQRRHQ